VGHLEQSGLGFSVLPEFIHQIHVARVGLILFSLTPALGFVALSLLPRVFFLSLRES
jgi:hypothetical protein